MKIFGSKQKNTEPWKASDEKEDEFQKTLANTKLEIQVQENGNIRLYARKDRARIVFGLNLIDLDDEQEMGYMISYDLPNGMETICKFEWEHIELLRPFISDEFIGIPSETIKKFDKAITALHYRFG